MIDWVTVSALATAGGTLVLAVATFGSVRSANRAARAAGRSLLAGLRPLLMPRHPHRPGRLPGRPWRRAVTGRRLRVTGVRGYFSSERAITIRWIWLVPS